MSTFSSFVDRDALVYMSSFCQVKEAATLGKTNTHIHKVIEHVPYKNYTLEWNSSYTEIKNIMKHNNAVYHLTINHFEFIDKMFVSLPKLQQLTIINCDMENLCLIYFYVNTLRVLVIDNCKIKDMNIELDKFKHLEKIIVNGNEITLNIKERINLTEYKYPFIECENMECN